MDITYVTAFLLRSNSKHSIEDYKRYFEQLAATEIRMVLFLDKRLSWTFSQNVHIIPISLEDMWVYQTVPLTVELPSVRSPVDTREYMLIINSKSECILRASKLNPWKTQWFAWIDFGIGHVFQHAETFERIRMLKPPHQPCIRIAGIWNWIPRSLFDQVCWRFAGGFLIIHEHHIEEFHEAVKASILRNLPHFAWEVNIWADIERNGLNLGWFASDHNDTIIPFSWS